MSFDELVDAILQEQDSVTHYNEEGADVPMRLHQKYRQEAVGSLRDWVKAQVAAEREACCAINAKLLEACEALVVRIDEWMALDMPCPLCDGYVPHFDDCPYTFAADAIRARAGEVVEVRR